MSVLVLGSINVDLVIRSNWLPRPGETVLGGEFFRAAGGKGANQAVAAARLGTPVTMIGAVGDDEFGEASRQGLVAEGIDARFVRTVNGCATGVALIMVDGAGQNQISVAAGANRAIGHREIDALPDSLFKSHRVFLASQEVPLDAVYAALQRARTAGMITMLNPAPAVEVISPVVARCVDWIIPNQHEARVVAGFTRTESAGIDYEPARQLVKLGCGTALVTMGQAGGLVVASKGKLTLEREWTSWSSLKVDAVDATAAGDAFCGALATAIVEGMELETGWRFAAAVAALSVTRMGAQPSLPRRDEFEAWYRERQIH